MTKTIDLIKAAELILNRWLVDNTELVFEEQPEIDEARMLLNNAIERMEKTENA
jgi:hypothetical protein